MWRMTAGMAFAASVAVTVAAAQSREAPASGTAPVDVVGSSGNMSPIVENLEAGVRFYTDLLGLNLSRPARTVSHTDVPPPPLLDNQGTPEARLRWVGITIPG
jgi:hypothetical protein